MVHPAGSDGGYRSLIRDRGRVGLRARDGLATLGGSETNAPEARRCVAERGRAARARAYARPSRPAATRAADRELARRRLFEALAQAFQHAPQPLLLVVDDLLELARSQASKSLELRAAMSLARL